MSQSKVERRHREAAVAAMPLMPYRREDSGLARWLDVGGDQFEWGYPLGDTFHDASEYNDVAQAIAEAEARGYARCQADVVARLVELELEQHREQYNEREVGIYHARLSIRHGEHVGAAERAKGGENG